MKLPKYGPQFESLRDIDEMFFSYSEFKSRFKRHLELKDSNTVVTFLQSINDTLWVTNYEVWQSEDDDFIQKVLVRLNATLQSCSKVKSSASKNVSSILSQNQNNSLTIEDLLKTLESQGMDYINTIRDDQLKASVTYLYAAHYAEYTINVNIGKIKRLLPNNLNNPIVLSSILIWDKKVTDTDLIELVTALYVSKSISNKSGDLTRKDAIEIFCQMFNRNVKYVESKLSRAGNRKKDTSPFLSKLKASFDEDCQRKDKLLDERRR